MIEFLAEELEDINVAALGVAHAHVEGVASKGPNQSEHWKMSKSDAKLFHRISAASYLSPASVMATATAVFRFDSAFSAISIGTPGCNTFVLIALTLEILQTDKAC